MNRLDPIKPLPSHTRRQLMRSSAALGVSFLVGEAHATPLSLQEAVKAFTGGAHLNRGRVRIDIAALVDNGNTVPVSIHAQSPMTATDHVTALALFSEKNPQSETFVARMNHLAGRASVSTRIRLANSQTLTAVARMNDGSYWAHSAEVIVTIAACIEDADE